MGFIRYVVSHSLVPDEGESSNLSKAVTQMIVPIFAYHAGNVGSNPTDPFFVGS